MNPQETFHNAANDEIVVRELTDDEYADALANGQTFEPEPAEEAPEE